MHLLTLITCLYLPPKGHNQAFFENRKNPFSGRSDWYNPDFFVSTLTLRSSQIFWYIIVFCRCSGSATMFKWKFEMKIKSNMWKIFKQLTFLGWTSTDHSKVSHGMGQDQEASWPWASRLVFSSSSTQLQKNYKSKFIWCTSFLQEWWLPIKSQACF